VLGLTLTGAGVLSATSGPPPRSAITSATAVFAGGCFWGVEAVFSHLRGVLKTTAGYAGGSVESPSYEQVGTGKTGHVESVRVVYDPAQISYRQLLEVFFTVAHDPTQRGRQGPDVGPEYQAVVFYGNADEQRAVTSYVAELEAAKTFRAPIATEIRKFTNFYPAEGYHQGYAAKHPDSPYIARFDAPKVEHLRQDFSKWYKE
jgi:peptide-methionine (S)-S-oxide reductase